MVRFLFYSYETTDHDCYYKCKNLESYSAMLNLAPATRTIRFSFRDIFSHQPQIVAIWRSLRSQNLHPVAHTFLGKIVSITLQP